MAFKLTEIDDGLSCRSAAVRLGGAPSKRSAGARSNVRQGVSLPSLWARHALGRVEKRADDILAIWEERTDITHEALRLALAEVGLSVSVSGLHRFFARWGMMRKKTGHARKQDRPDVLNQRREWFEG